MSDNNQTINHFTKRKLQFVTRLKLNRWVRMKNKNGGKIDVQTERMNQHMKLNHKAQITKIEDGKESVIYLTRWKCDECYRYIKQSYNLEDLRVKAISPLETSQ